MALSYTNYTGDGTTDTFAINFTYQDTSEISVTVDGVAETGLTFPSAASVQLTSAPASSAIVQVRRTTDLATRAVDFASGSVLTEEDLDNSAIQLFHSAQEAVDRVGDTIGLDTTNRWDAGNNRIINVGSPTASTDAATKAYADSIVTAAEAAAIAAAQAEVSTATGNIIPDATKLAIHPIGSQYTLSDGTTTDYSAKHYQDAAATSGTNAATSETNAATSETNAQNWAVKTDGEAVTGQGYSAKAWSVGGTGITDTAGAGPAKDWAVETTGLVDGTEFSSKEYAIGTQVTNLEGSAKQWALGGGSGFDRDTAVKGAGAAAEYSAKYWANQAANSAKDFVDVYYGSFTSDSNAEDYQLNTNEGTVNVGDLYFNSTDNVMRVRTFSGWQDVATDTSSLATNGFAIAMAIAL
jgi:hypothetical protein